MSLGRYRNPSAARSNFGAAYEGDFFYAEYYAGPIRRLKHNGRSWVNPPAVPGQPNATDWATGFHDVADAAIGSDGAIYYVRQFAPGFTAGIAPPHPREPERAASSRSCRATTRPANAGQPLFEPARRPHDHDRRDADRRPDTSTS